MSEAINIFEFARDTISSELPTPVRTRREHKPPELKINHGATGPLYVTDDFIEDWENEKEEKKKQKKEKTKRDYERKLIQLISLRAQIDDVLSTLRPRKEKDRKKLAALNIQRIEINDEIAEIQDKSGLNINNLEMGSRVSRFLNKIKRTMNKIKEKVKDFYERHEDVIVGVLTVAVPVFLSMIVRKLIFRM